MDGNLTDASIPGQSELGSNGNKVVTSPSLELQKWSFTTVRCLISNPEHKLHYCTWSNIVPRTEFSVQETRIVS